ncbi:leucine-rich repeat and fibronectin type III domain-containing protein 1-like protein [Pecten maximus]|uniref:leucine-rich repeat and fibronectin type III domain-containing protein 1-like protein n=1 Tax=Pecten maximus TaxID=6579 RepID=UPI001458FB33|nr:leucine-rich repeat and fibronectin type III domain-containing protein 1-like protein [Pecten maximus]
MPGLVTLKMAHCEINAIADDTFSSHTSLLYLDLSYNKILRITDKTFEGLTHLVSLQISGNQHCKFDENAFDGLSYLQELYIANMDLTRISLVMFASLKNLRLLDIHGNKIWKIEFDFRSVFPNLQYLDASKNLLDGLSKLHNNSFSNLNTAKLSGNPLQCNCELRWLKHVSKKVLDPEYGSDALVCAGPERLKFAPILRVPDLEFKCVPPEIINCTTETYVVMETAPLRMLCELAGDPYPEVTWTRYDGKHVEFTYEHTSNYYVSRTGSLDIFNVSKADEGTWTLSVTNTIGKTSHQLEVDVTPNTTSTTNTSTARITTANPTTGPPTVTWMKTTAEWTTTTLTTPIITPASNITSSKPLANWLSAIEQSTSFPGIAALDTMQENGNSAGFTVLNTDDKETMAGEASGHLYMIIAGAVGGGFVIVVVLVIVAIIYCVKRKQNTLQVHIGIRYDNAVYSADGI